MAEEVKLSITLAGDASGAEDALAGVADAAKEAADAVEGIAGASDSLDELGEKSEAAKGRVNGLWSAMRKDLPSMDSLKKAVPLGNLVAAGLSAAAKAAKALAAASAAAGAAAAAAVVKFGVEQERTRLKMQVLLGDAAKGDKLMAQLSGLANATPFGTSEVVEAGQALLSYGIAAGDVQAAMVQVGNAAAATGRSIAQMAEMYGKAMARGKADAETLNQMAGAGVPVVQALADRLGVAREQVWKLASQGRISSADLAAAFASLSEQGGVFGGMMQRQSQTVGGLWSTLAGKLQQAAGTLGEQLAPVMARVLQWAVELADRIYRAVADGTVVQALGNWAEVGVAFFMQLQRTAFTCWEYIKAGALFLGDVLEGVFDDVAAAVLGVVGTVQKAWQGVVNGFVAAYNAVASLAGFDELEDVDWGDSTMQAAREYSGRALEAAGRSSRRFADASSASDAFDAESEAKEEELSKGIRGMVDGVLTSIREGGKAAEAAVLDTAGAARPVPEDAAAPASRPENGRPEADSLARIGLYNFGAQAVNSLDVRRNALLERIAAAVAAPSARQEVYAV